MSWLDDLIGSRFLQNNALTPDRKNRNFNDSDTISVTMTDNDSDGQTDISLSVKPSVISSIAGQSNRLATLFLLSRNNQEELSENNAMTSIAWSPLLRLFCAVSSSGTTRAQKSENAIDWSGSALTTANSWNAICWAATRFITVASSGTNRTANSDDGHTFTLVAAAEANSWMAACYSPLLERVVAVASDGTHRVMYSDDEGDTWTVATAAEANGWRSVCWNPVLNKFFAISIDGTNRMMSSSDGITWSTVSITSSQWMSITCSPSGRMVAFSYDGIAIWSDNGTTWNAATVPDANAYTCVVYAEEIEAFVAISDSGTDYRIAMSFDGGTFEMIRTEPNGVAEWTSIAWAPELLRFSAVAGNSDNAFSLRSI